MKAIIYTKADGNLAMVRPFGGARLAFAAVLNGRRIILADQIVAQGDKETTVRPIRVDQFFRRWPLPDGAVAEWAETEDELAARTAATDVAVLLDQPYVNEQGREIRMMLRTDALAEKRSFTETPFQIIEEAQIPADRTFRNAWKRCSVRGCVVDMPKAQAIARDMLRRTRSERFKTLDGQWMRETAKGNTASAAQIEAKREELRNWPADPRIAVCGSADDLKALMQQMLSEV